MDFNYIDALLILIILFSLFVGWQRGLISGLLDLARWIGSFLAALYFYQPVSHFVARLLGWEEVWAQPAAFILIVVLAGLLIQTLGGFLIGRLPQDIHERRANKILGVLPGLFSGLITAAIVSALLFSMPFSDNFHENLRQSQAANRLAAYADELETALAPIFGDALEQTLNRRTPIKPESNEIVSLPFKIENPRPRPELEAEMLQMVNAERIANGLSPLEADPELTEVARRHSADMFARGYFSHNTPEGKSPFDRIRESEVRFRIAGENLALAPTLSIAHTGLMNSPGHRANILRSQFGRVGIGVLDGGRRGLMVTQNFRN
jgi:uncharacterized protein YkwD